ncbi:MAG: hypothetical protein KGQ59_02965 [Bdellovibrionales bacterium]|nr:hypothetical protein [Bdellovibrionales bacterium]
MKVLRLISFCALALSLSACGGKATAKLQFSKASSSPQLKETSPLERGLTAAHSFKMKFIAAYLSEDINPTTQNNTGKTSMFWLNSECSDDIKSCTTDPTSNGGKDEDGVSWRHTIMSFFDFSNVPNVNTTLNSQGREIDTGTYKYVRLEFCKWQGTENPTYNNIKWTAVDGGTEYSFSQPSCGVTAEISPPMEVAAGESVTITLNYSLENTLQSGTGPSNCAGGTCFSLPTFTPSVTK